MATSGDLKLAIDSLGHVSAASMTTCDCYVVLTNREAGTPIMATVAAFRTFVSRRDFGGPLRRLPAPIPRREPQL